MSNSRFVPHNSFWGTFKNFFTTFSCKTGVNYFQPFLLPDSLAKYFKVMTWAYLMIVHFKRCHLNTSLDISNLPVGDLFYVTMSLQIQADILLHSALINVSQHLHFLSWFFHASLGFLWLTSTLCLKERKEYFKWPYFFLVRGDKIPQLLPPCAQIFILIF